MNLQLTDRLGRLASQSLGTHPSSLPIAGITGEGDHAWLLCGCRDHRLGHQTARTLPTESLPSSQHTVL